MNTVIQDARKALESDGSSDRLDTLHAQLKERINERAGRLQAITARDTSSIGSNPGPERTKLVESGDIEALRKLDLEERDLGPELEILRNLQGKLRQRLDETRAREYVGGMSEAFAELAELVAANAQANEAARKARQAVDAKLKELQAQRRHVTRQKVVNGQKLELPAADPELLRQFMAVHGYTYHRGQRVGWFSPTGGPHDLKNVAEVLGLDVPRPEQQAAA